GSSLERGGLRRYLADLHRGAQGQDRDQLGDIPVVHADAAVALPVPYRGRVVCSVKSDDPSALPTLDRDRVGEGRQPVRIRAVDTAGDGRLEERDDVEVPIGGRGAFFAQPDAELHDLAASLRYGEPQLLAVHDDAVRSLRHLDGRGWDVAHRAVRPDRQQG